MFADEMRQIAERSVTQIREDKALKPFAEPTDYMLARYLEGLRHLFVNTPRVLGVAAERAQLLGRRKLETYLRRKIVEEADHDLWARADLAKLPVGVTAGVRVLGSASRIVEQQIRWAYASPISLAGYAQWAEYFTVLVGAEWLTNSGRGVDEVSAVYKHLEADKDHAAAGFAEIAGLCVSGEQKIVLDAMQRSSELFIEFFREVVS